MLIHFAFGSKKENTDDQTELVIENILKGCRLRYSSECYEFLPTLHYPNPNSYSIDTRSFKLIGNQLTSPPLKLPLDRKENNHILKQMDAKIVKYLPKQIQMICFINIPFNKLKLSPHGLTYGKFGIVFGKRFIKKFKPQQFVYYKETDLFNDKKVIQYNQLLKLPSRTTDQNNEIIKISEEILLYRKPYKLWPSFHESVIAKIHNNNPKLQPELTLWQYDRYPENYDFSKEQEWRLSNLKVNNNEYLNFSVEDIEAIIVPDIKSRDKVCNYIEEQNYQYTPKILLFPS